MVYVRTALLSSVPVVGVKVTGDGIKYRVRVQG